MILTPLRLKVPVLCPGLRGEGIRQEHEAACALAYLRQGHTLHVRSIDRLCRNLADLLRTVIGLRDKGICVRFHKEGLAIGYGEPDATSESMPSMLRAVTQFERTLLKERQREGIA